MTLDYSLQEMSPKLPLFFATILHSVLDMLQNMTRKFNFHYTDERIFIHLSFVK